MDSPRIVLTTSSLTPKTWTSTSQLHIGRLPELEVIIDEPSISRRHAEVSLADEGWVIRDLGSSNGTHLNGVRIGRTPQPLRKGDSILLGDVELRVEVLRGLGSVVRIGKGRTVQIEAASRRTWEEAVDMLNLSDDRWKEEGKAFLRLMRYGYRLSHAQNPDEQLQHVMNEAVVLFGAQRGGIFLADGATGQLEVRFLTFPPNGSSVPGAISKTPANRAFGARHSLLFQDCKTSPELQAAQSIAKGSMTSIICAVLRSPERIFGVLHLDRGFTQSSFTEEDLYLADSLAAALALGIERLEMIERQQEVFLQTVTALSQAVEMRDFYTGNHTQRVTTYSLILAEELGVPAEQRKLLQAAAALHDIGKIAIDDHILRKPGRLSDSELNQMKTHTTRGSEIIQMIPGLAWALPVVRSHHERWDGTGYPDGLRGEGIPLLARVVGVADAFDAMTSDRPYRKGMSLADAYAEIERTSGSQFDPNCVRAFTQVRPQIAAILERENEFRRQAGTGTDTISVREMQRESGIIPLPKTGVHRTGSSTSKRIDL